MHEHEFYENPLNTRYASPEMSALFSDKERIILWRELWIALAEGEKELGLNISETQINDMKRYVRDINWEVAAAKEKEVRHDVMAHVHAFGAQAKSAMPIIHLGATSCYVTDNAELITIYRALRLVQGKLLTLMTKLSSFAEQYKDLPTLGFTHLQPAQLTTVGKRATLWLQDLLLDYENIEFILSNYKLRGVKGTTGTQASFLSLFNDDHAKVRELNRKVIEKMGFQHAYAVSGQTYTRKFDYFVLSALSGTAQSAYKFSNDMRLLQNMKEMEEPFESKQIGSSAMAYKRNPMRSERMGSLARFCITMPENAAITASTQWFERTLDDSANKRITIAQSFLALDGVLDLYINIVSGMVVYEKIIARHIAAELPFMATETVLMECVKHGGDRQSLHESIRIHSMESAKRVKAEGLDNDLIDRIKGDEAFACIKDKIDSVMDARNFIGRASMQVEEFLNENIAPLLEKNAALAADSHAITV